MMQEKRKNVSLMGDQINFENVPKEEEDLDPYVTDFDKDRLEKEDNGQFHPCDFCGRVFRKRSKCIDHMRTHEPFRAVFQCPEESCDRSFLHKRNLTSHIRTFHNGQKFPCTFEGCSQTLTSLQNLKKHIRKMHEERAQSHNNPDRPFVCEIKSCSASFTRKDHLKRHVKNIHLKTENEGFIKVEPADEDEYLSDPDEPTIPSHLIGSIPGAEEGWECKCQCCPKVFSCDKELSNHFDIEHDEEMSCLSPTQQLNERSEPDSPSEVTKTPPEFNLADMSHGTLAAMMQNQRKYSSKLGKELISEKSMELGHEGHPPLVKVRHLIEDQNESTKDSEHYELLQASPPQTSTIQLKSLQLEVQSATHTSEKAFVCGFPGCPASYSRKDHLKRHTENTHESRRLEFRCSECPRKYANSSSLRLHVKTKHSNGASSFRCGLCGEAFAKNNLYLAHMAQHSGHTRTFPCGHCFREFTRRTSLFDHMKTHDAVRSKIQCPEENCSALFLHQRNVYAHIRTVHGGLQRREKAAAPPIPP